MQRTRLTFQSNAGVELDAVLTSPQKPISYALYAHCFTCTKEIAAARRIAAELGKQGVAVLRFDFAGLGKSGGDFSKTTFSGNVAELMAVAEQMSERYEAPHLLIGHSLGGAAALAAGCKLSAPRAVVVIGTPSEPAHVQKLFESEIDKIRERGKTEVKLAGRPFTITRDFVDDLDAYDLEKRIGSLGKALLILHSPQDMTVAIEEAAKIFYSARHPKSFVSLDGADHLLSKREDAAYAARVISAWSSRYL